MLKEDKIREKKSVSMEKTYNGVRHPVGRQDALRAISNEIYAVRDFPS